ncbi:hypothetical protein TH53_18145 [Pedobacter lusitanus]|uniref:Uncharacterized protein n=1 Tax=Pedobacter lusitanus TaxID=1503925 RepID=A0A0D0GEW6_9SPHI|nr:hypothetical protein [Pedobacter lusitanus]KIO75822.1 hypothetical protein TH53_18145 [Pedobacter lusitanus]
MKVSREDPFDQNLCIRGLGVLTTYMHSDLYEYVYYLTFKRSMKAYAKDFNDAWEKSIDEDEFFKKIDDPFVQNCRSAQLKLIDLKMELILRFGIEETEDLENGTIVIQSQRFRPFVLLYKRSKSYKKLKLYYLRTLVGIIECLYFYACVLTIQSNKIPLMFKKQFKLPDQEWSWLLNQDDNNVRLLTEVISGLKEDLGQLKRLVQK